MNSYERNLEFWKVTPKTLNHVEDSASSGMQRVIAFLQKNRSTLSLRNSWFDLASRRQARNFRSAIKNISLFYQLRLLIVENLLQPYKISFLLRAKQECHSKVLFLLKNKLFVHFQEYDKNDSIAPLTNASGFATCKHSLRVRSIEISSEIHDGGGTLLTYTYKYPREFVSKIIPYSAFSRLASVTFFFLFFLHYLSRLAACSINNK